jgi:hypothetical protein
MCGGFPPHLSAWMERTCEGGKPALRAVGGMLMKKKMDDTNKAIIQQLSSDGRKAFSSISQELGITENTVRTRVSKLVADQTMQITSLVNPEALPGSQVVFHGGEAFHAGSGKEGEGVFETARCDERGCRHRAV